MSDRKPRYAFITPSYGPDFDRCRLLSRSVNEFVSGDWEHHVIVDARDRAMFAPLEGPRTRVRTVESVLPWWIRRVPGARRWWLSLRTPPIRNWILQQVVKLSVGEHTDADVYVFCDSDVTFIRPFSVDALAQGDDVRLFRVPGAAKLPGHMRWHGTAARLLGLPETDYFGSTYIGNLIVWRRDCLKKMYERIAAVARGGWLPAVCRQWHLSEYILYGVFVEHVLKQDHGHFYTDVPLCHISWDYELRDDADIERFFQEVAPQHVAVMVSAKQAIPVERYERLLARFR